MMMRSTAMRGRWWRSGDGCGPGIPTTYLDSGGATFTGFEKVVGSLGGRTGSFVLRHTGSYDGEKATAEYEVVPGSGTDELDGLSGTGGFSAGHAEEHDMTLDYDV